MIGSLYEIQQQANNLCNTQIYIKYIQTAWNTSAEVKIVLSNLTMG